MDFKVLIAQSAIADLKEIVEFVAQDDVDAASRLGHKLIDQALGLGTFPARLPFHDVIARYTSLIPSSLSETRWRYRNFKHLD